MSFWIGYSAGNYKVASIEGTDVALDDAGSDEQAIAKIERHMKGASTEGERDRCARQGRITPTTACWYPVQ